MEACPSIIRVGIVGPSGKPSSLLLTKFVDDIVMTQEDPFSDIRSVAPIYDRMLRGETIRRTDLGFDILLEDFHRALVYS